jgi:D-alanyl-lipoteichoic acid acyltransferase DltB (MBOAT superfamily)
MELISLRFLLLVAAALALYGASRRPGWRIGVLALANAAFIAMLLPASPLDAWALALFLGLGYAALCAVDGWRDGRCLAAAIAVVLAVFLYLKQYAVVGFLPALPAGYAVIGLSYVLFRVIHLLVDTWNGAVAVRPGVAAYLAYVCFFPAFVSGPVHRYEPFARQLAGPPADTPSSPEEAFAAFARIVAGLAKILLLSSAFQGLFGIVARPLLDPDFAGIAPAGRGALAFAASAALYALYLYFNFSGYTDVAIGVGRLFGIVLPENFDRPYRAGSMLEFWTRWHISLSVWFRDYLFTPLATALTRRFPSGEAAAPIAVASLFVTFLTMGLWHGTTAAFLWYGLFLGAGAAVNKLWQVEMAKRLGRKRYRALTGDRTYALLCRGLALAYFATALACFWLDGGQLARVFGTLGAAGTASAFAAMTAAATLFAAVADPAEAWGRRALDGAAERLRRRRAVRDACLGAGIFALIALATLFNGAPEFVYGGY